MKNRIIAVSVFLCASAHAITSEVVRIKFQEVTPAELVDTMLEAGEAVVTRDESNSQGTVTIHVGDGATPGGAIVSDPFSFKAAYTRQLLRSEYTMTPYGNAAYSNNVWDLITPIGSGYYSAANTGGVFISSAYPIARVEGTKISSHSALTENAINTTIYTVSTNFVIGAEETDDSVPSMADSYRAGVSNLIVYTWVGSHLLGITNNATSSTFLVGTPAHESAAIPLGWWQGQMTNHYGQDWSLYGAYAPVDLAYQDLWHNPYVSCVSTGYAGSVVWRRNYYNGETRDLMTLTTTNREFHIATYEATTTSVVVRIDASLPFASAPVIQFTTNLHNAVWTNLTTACDWPISSWYTESGVRKWRVFTLSASYATTDQAFFKVNGTATNTPVEALTLDVPLRMYDYGTSTYRSVILSNGVFIAQ